MICSHLRSISQYCSIEHNIVRVSFLVYVQCHGLLRGQPSDVQHVVELASFSFLQELKMHRSSFLIVFYERVCWKKEEIAQGPKGASSSFTQLFSVWVFVDKLYRRTGELGTRNIS